jgi:hypothetical protein
MKIILLEIGGHVLVHNQIVSISRVNGVGHHACFLRLVMRNRSEITVHFTTPEARELALLKFTQEWSAALNEPETGGEQ